MKKEFNIETKEIYKGYKIYVLKITNKFPLYLTFSGFVDNKYTFGFDTGHLNDDETTQTVDFVMKELRNAVDQIIHQELKYDVEKVVKKELSNIVEQIVAKELGNKIDKKK